MFIKCEPPWLLIRIRIVRGLMEGPTADIARKAVMLVHTDRSESFFYFRVLFAETDSCMLDIFPRTLCEAVPGVMLLP
jgi:hypothetical protein